MDSENGALPHHHLYTRLRPSPGKGIGVFAIRDIPEGLDPFTGEGSGTVRVPRSAVESLADPEVKQMYIDFCPLLDEHYLAPASFNRLTTAWYMNHSDRPNVVSDRGINFVAARPIRAGEELTVDYRTFSDHADAFIPLWSKDPRA
jgi:SET domain-containing protein